MFQNEPLQQLVTNDAAFLDASLAALAVTAANDDDALRGALLAVLVNATNENAPACRHVGARDDGAHLALVVRCVLDARASFDSHVQAIALLVNLIEHDRRNREALATITVNGFVDDNVEDEAALDGDGDGDERLQSALLAVADLFEKEGEAGRNTTEERVRGAYQALLLACAIKNCLPNEEILIGALDYPLIYVAKCGSRAARKGVRCRVEYHSDAVYRVS